jgi:pimeloyl-[acyl-carrier protein] methyl ester esterase
MVFYYSKTPFFFKFYLIDLPGCGINKNMSSMKTEELIEMLYNKMPRNSIWLGWSIGGLIASRIALSYPEHILALISVASSPCFIEKKNWPGIKKHTAYQFYSDLTTNYNQTIRNFFYLQQKDPKKYFYNLTSLRKIVFSQSQPNVNLLKNGLEIICSMDLRLEMTFIKVPFLRIYGSMDNLVPQKIIHILDEKWLNTSSVIIKKATHIPFISHSKEFCSILLNFTKLL